MVAIRLHRYAVEALLDAPPQIGVNRLSYEAAVAETTGGSIQLHRMGVEVLAKVEPKVGVQRLSYEAAVEEAAGGAIQLHRMGVEVLLGNIPEIGIQRISYEAAVEETIGGAIQLHRFAIEALARTGVPNPTPLALATDIEFWMHNWADEVEIETGYSTDVIRSPETLAEERRSLMQRPERTMKIVWLRSSFDEAYQLRLMLRRMTNENIQIPLYPEATEITQDVGVSDTRIYADVDNRRFFAGGRVLIFPTTSTYISRTAVKTAKITTLKSNFIEVDVAPGILKAQQWSIVPLIDCEKMLDPTINALTGEVYEIKLDVREYKGKNSLPPVTVGLRAGFPIRLGRPVFFIEQNWIRGITTTYKRYGTDQRIGRRLVPLPEGDRYSQKQKWNLAPILRPDWFRILSLFDSRRGRAESFWCVDLEFTWSLALTSSGFIDVVPYGRFVDFNQNWTEQNMAAAIVMKSGEIHLAQIVNVIDNGSTWRLTIAAGQSIEDPIDLTQIDFFARARLTRFDSDTLSEKWITNNVVNVKLSTIEVQNEKTVDYDA